MSANIFLHVIADFASYLKGEIIRDVDAIESILETNPHHVVAVAIKSDETSKSESVPSTSTPSESVE